MQRPLGDKLSAGRQGGRRARKEGRAARHRRSSLCGSGSGRSCRVVRKDRHFSLCDYFATIGLSNACALAICSLSGDRTRTCWDHQGTRWDHTGPVRTLWPCWDPQCTSSGWLGPSVHWNLDGTCWDLQCTARRDALSFLSSSSSVCWHRAVTSLT